jgi:N-acetylglucosamine-6-phosphate deacetylase
MILQGKILGSGEGFDIYIEGGIISRVEPHSPAAIPHWGGPDLYVSPGFFDPQVNGFAGVDFNGKDLTLEGLHRATVRLAASGVTCFFPTLTTAPFDKTLARLKMLSAALGKDPLLRRMAAGIHLEGPYISPAEGFRGAHPREFVRSPRWEELQKFQEAGNGHIRCLTLAPELEGAIPFIERAAKNGMVVALGHTNASEKILEEAFRAGAKLSTHLGNGAHAFLPRHRNPINKQLAMDGLMASIIVDGIHLPDYVVKNFIRAKGVERILLTTDSMAGAGAPPGQYTIGEVDVEIKETNGPARFPGTPYLAGSTLTMDRAITNVTRFAQIPLAEALQMAGENGGNLFPEVKKDISPGSPANIVLFEYNGEVRIKNTWIQGEMIFG